MAISLPNITRTCNILGLIVMNGGMKYIAIFIKLSNTILFNFHTIMTNSYENKCYGELKFNTKLYGILVIQQNPYFYDIEIHNSYTSVQLQI